MRERFTSGCFEVAVCFRALSARNSLLRFPKTNEMYHLVLEVGEEGDVFVSTWLQYVLTWGFVGTKNPDRRSGLWSS